MAKRNKALDAIKTDALKAVAAMDERPVFKKGSFGKNDIKSIPEKIRGEVQSRNDAYLGVADRFNRTRNEMAVTKLNLMLILDEPLVESGMVSKSGYWNIIGIDKGNILYTDSEVNVISRLKKYVARVLNKPVSVSQDDESRWSKTAWDWAEEDIPELVQLPSQGTLGGTPDDTTKLPPKLKGAEQLYLIAYRSIKGEEQADRRRNFFIEKLTIEERARFLTMLRDKERNTLFSLLDENEQEEINEAIEAMNVTAA